MFETYKTFEKYNLKQLHFHTVDNKSLLRFHRPDKYGDSLAGVRQTVEYVNRHKVPIDGFEEGKIYNGFRFVYPIFDDGLYLGSVEVSFSVLYVLEEFINTFGYKTDFFIQKGVVNSKLMKDELGNYVQSALKDFFIEKSVFDKIHSAHKNISFCNRNQQRLEELNKLAIESKEPFSFYFCDKMEVITFIPLIHPVTQESVGVLAVSKNTNYIQNKTDNTLYTFLVLTFIMGIGLIFAYREIIGKRKTHLINEQLNKAQRIAKVGNWELDLRTNTLHWSDEIFNIFELDKENFGASYEAFLNAIHPEDRDMVNEAYQKSLKTKEPYSIEHRLMLADGRIKYVKENCESIFDEHGIALKSSGTIQDITEQKEIELSLKNSEQRFSDVTEASGEYIWEIDKEGKYTFLTKPFEDLLKYTIEECIGRTPFSFMPEDEAQRVGRYFTEEIASSGLPFKGLVHKSLTKKGNIVWQKVNGLPIFEDGNIVGYRGAALDITSEKLFQDSLEDAQKRIEIILNASKIGLWEFDMIANTIYWDNRSYEMLGYSNQEFNINYEKWLELMNPDDVEQITKELHLQIQTGEPFRLEFRMKHKNGQWFWIDGRGEVIEYTPEGKPSKMAGIHIDANSQKEIQEILAIAKTKAEAANKTKSEFLANMSHEIRTPMNAIIGLGSILSDLIYDAKQKDILQKINSSSKILLGIINDILDYSKIEAGKLELEYKNFELDSILSSLKVIFEHRASEKGIELYFHIKNDLPRVIISDELKLTQVLSNMLSNAIKFTHKGIVTLNIELLSQNNDTNKANIRFRVEDSGIGMSDEQLLKIFNPFTQADSSTTRQYGGTGLGLVICKSIVEALGGQITVNSVFGKGTVFSFDLELEFSTCNLQHTVVSKECNKVLIVDDQEIARIILRDMLENFGCKCYEASNGLEALELIEQANQNQDDFDILLIDWNMPVLNGVETLKKLRSMKYDKTPAIFMISASSKENINFDDVDIDNFISKPVTPSSLFDALVTAKRGYRTDKVYLRNIVPEFNGLSVLVVEDNEINQQVVTMLLQKVGVVVDVADNGKEGLEKFMANESKYDLILMDLQMPIMSGYEATQKIREFNKDIPIVALTAAAMIEDREKALEAGMSEHLGKPIDQNELYGIIAKFTKKDFDFIENEKNHESILDIASLSRTIGSQELIDSLLIKFKNQLISGEFKDIVTLIENKDERASNMIHTLKGVSGNLCANELFKISKLVDAQYKANETIKESHIRDLREAIKNLLDRLSEFREENTFILASNKKVDKNQLSQLIKTTKQNLVNGDLIEDELKLELITSLYGVVDSEELENFKHLIEEFEFDKALELLNGWDV